MNDNSNDVSGNNQLEPVAAKPARPLKVVLSSVSSDSHTWNLVYMQLLLEELGHEVINLGACVPDEMIMEECQANAPDMLVISSVNGHGNIDGERLIRKIRDNPQLAALPAIIGGKLCTKGAQALEQNQALLLKAGFTQVFQDAQGVKSIADISDFKPYMLQVASAVPQSDKQS